MSCVEHFARLTPRNVDHFFFLDVDDLNAKPTSKAKKSFSGFNIVNDAVIAEHTVEDFTFFGPEMPAGRPHLLQSGRFKVLGKTPDEEVMVFGAKGDLLKKSLMDSFENLADPDVFKHKDYAIMNVGPSVLPAYIPSARIFSYNISGVVLEDDFVARPFVPLVQDQEDETDSTEEEDLLLKKECKKPENADKPKCSFKNKPRYSSPESPSRSNKPLTPLGFTQFFLPDIEDQKNKPKFKVEYTTFKTKELLPDNLSGQKRTQPPPVPYHLLPGWDTSIGQAAAVPEPELELDDVNADIDIDTPVNSTKGKGKGKKEKATDRFLKEVKKVTPYKMKDLTINSYIKLSRQLCADKKLWGQFTDYMFVSSGGD